MPLQSQQGPQCLADSSAGLSHAGAPNPVHPESPPLSPSSLCPRACPDTSQILSPGHGTKCHTPATPRWPQIPSPTPGSSQGAPIPTQGPRPLLAAQTALCPWLAGLEPIVGPVKTASVHPAPATGTPGSQAEQGGQSPWMLRPGGAGWEECWQAPPQCQPGTASLPDTNLSLKTPSPTRSPHLCLPAQPYFPALSGGRPQTLIPCLPLGSYSWQACLPHPPPALPSHPCEVKRPGSAAQGDLGLPGSP